MESGLGAFLLSKVYSVVLTPILVNVLSGRYYSSGRSGRVLNLMYILSAVLWDIPKNRRVFC